MTARALCLLLALSLSAELLAVPRPRPRPRPPRRHPPVRRVGDALKGVPWQLVLAGGAAASGVVFAYKVGDGLQKGTVEAAREAPERFLDKFGGPAGTVRIAAAVITLAAIAYAVWRISLRGRPPTQAQLPEQSSPNRETPP